MENLNENREKLKKDGYALLKYDDGAVHSYPYDTPWLEDEKFNNIYNIIRTNTLVDRTRCYALYLLMEQVKKIPGDVLEIGTWRGGTAGIFSKMLPEKTIYLADTFQGVVKSSEWEHYKDKAHSDTSIEIVTDLLGNKLKVSNYKILKGIFPEDTGEMVKDKKWAFINIDVDVYLSAKDSFNYIWNNLSQHGIVAFDDFGFIAACSGISKFVNEIKNNPNLIFIPNLNGQAYIIKL